MSGKNIKYKNPVQLAIKHPDYPLWLNSALLAGILIVTFWCYHYSLNNQFISWDDSLYVYDNSYLSSQNLKMLLLDTRSGNFHPITMLSLALNWHYSGANPRAYYVTEIILHLLNTMLVFFLALALFNAMVKRGYGQINNIPYLAGLCALWHGIHPMHVESVSWIAERKDVLYFFFYLLGLIVYVKYVIESRKILLALIVILYCLSLLSKPMAVVFPLSLLAIDVLLKRKIKWNLLIEKIPLLIVSLIFGYITYQFQSKLGAVRAFHSFTIFQRSMFIGYNYLMYLIKLFVPAHLCSFYPYPDRKNLPFYFYLAPFTAISITAGLLYFTYKKGENYFRVALFGICFYFFNVMLILQFVSAGSAIMADRYSYVSYVGVIFMLVYFIHVLINKIPAFKIPVIIISTAFSCMLAYVCHARTKVWHNSETFWTDVIKQYPHRLDRAYTNLGNYYFEQFESTNSDTADMDRAYVNFIEAINLKTTEQPVYSCMGTIMCKKNDYKLSLYYYTIALNMDSTNADVYIDRALAYFKMGSYDLAIQDCRRASRLKPNSELSLYDLAWAYLNAKQFDSAIKYYNRLIRINPANSIYYRYRGAAEFDKGTIKPAMDDFMQNLRIAPHDSQCMFFLSKTYNSINDFNNAYKYAQMAQDAQYSLPDDYIQSLRKRLLIK